MIFNISGCEIQKEKEVVINEIFSFSSRNLASINLPKSEEIINVELNEPLNKSDTKLSEEDIKDLFNNANIISPDDQILKEWHYAPWYSGSFKTKDGTYKFQLYLGDLGFLTNPKNDVGAFKFKL